MTSTCANRQTRREKHRFRTRLNQMCASSHLTSQRMSRTLCFCRQFPDSTCKLNRDRGQSFRPLEAGRLRIDSGGRCQPRLQPFERRYLWVNTHGSIQRFRCLSVDITSENSRKQENSSFSFHFLTLRLMKTRVCWSKKEASPHGNNVFALKKKGDIPPKTAENGKTVRFLFTF